MKRMLTAFYRLLFAIAKYLRIDLVPLGTKSTLKIDPSSTFFYSSNYTSLITASTLASLLALFTGTLVKYSDSSNVAHLTRSGIIMTRSDGWYERLVNDIQSTQQDQLLAFMLSDDETEKLEICAQVVLQNNNEVTNLEFDPFDPALGILNEVEIKFTGFLMANIMRTAVNATQVTYSFNSDLIYNLPTGSQGNLPLSATYVKDTRDPEMQQFGYEEYAENMGQVFESTETITQLEIFQGLNKIQLPVQAQNLVDFENPTKKVNSDMKIKACVIYSYSSN